MAEEERPPKDHPGLWLPRGQQFGLLLFTGTVFVAIGVFLWMLGDPMDLIGRRNTPRWLLSGMGAALGGGLIVFGIIRFIQRGRER